MKAASPATSSWLPPARFFVVLAIFLVVLVIGTFVVPILKVLRERDATKRYRQQEVGRAVRRRTGRLHRSMTEARVQASLRDNARADGRKSSRTHASAEQQVASTLQTAHEHQRERDVNFDLRAHVGTMSATLASRMLVLTSPLPAATR